MKSWIDAGLVAKTENGRLAHWLGQSGRSFCLIAEDVADFAMHESDIYMLVNGSTVMWVGSNLELVSEPASRRRFVEALATADGVMRLERSGGEADRMSTIADLEGAAPVTAVQAA